MNEEIDIIELLQRVKEGNEPKRIEIYGVVYERNTDVGFSNCIELLYQHIEKVDDPVDWWLDDKDVSLDTKIKILDKPIIEELEKKIISDELIDQTVLPTKEELMNKINEIIKWINNKE